MSKFNIVRTCMYTFAVLGKCKLFSLPFLKIKADSKYFF